ncbi:MAG: BolA/IbaG family iron-sulfur metabolism protein [Halioglobus sp.]
MNVQTEIEQNLNTELQPELLEVSNESHMHSVPPNSETHFKVVVVSAQFDGKRKVARHQQVYQVLSDQLAGPVHALALHTYTPDEWTERQQASPDSPDCLGGSKSEGG